MDCTLGSGKTRGIQDQHPPRTSDPGSIGCLGCNQYRLFDEICSGGPGIDGFDVLAGLVRTARPVLAQRRIELGHVAGHWFGFLWNPDYRQSWSGRPQPLGTADLGSRSRHVIAKHDDDPLHRVG